MLIRSRFLFGVLAAILCFAGNAFSQTVVPDFSIPAQVCVNMPVNITNTSQNASSYYWNFCTADINQSPAGVNLGNPGGNLSLPVFMDYVQFNGNYYGFVINHFPGKLIRLDFGNSLLNTPTSIDLGNFGGIIPSGYGAEGIQVVQNEGKWYAIIVGGYVPSGHTPRILKVEFGANLTNTSPVATNWGNIGNMDSPHDLHLFKEGNAWYGFTVSAQNNSLTRFSFTNSFDNTPTGTNLGGFGLLDYPDGVFATNDNGFWRVFVTNDFGSSRLVRLDFGSSLLNPPTAVSISNVGNTNGLRDITLIKYCNQTVGFGVNGTNYHLYRLNFPDLASPPVVTDLGNVGSLAIPHSISKIFRVNDDLYSFITNVNSNSITRLRFGGCNSSSFANSSLQQPAPIIYNTPGIYNINLTVDDGLPTQSSICKQIEVLPGLPKRPLQKMQYCPGGRIKLGTAISSANYLWSTGAVTDSIVVSSPGIYWVESSRAGCSSRDSFEISQYDPKPEFTQRQDACDPFTIQLTGSNVVNAGNHYWDFGDGATGTQLEITHTYAAAGNYLIRYAAGNGTCADTISKLLNIGPGPGDVILTSDTTICIGSSITLNTAGSLGHCWQTSPVIPNPQMPSPVITPVNDETFFVTAEKTGANLALNGDFSAGNVSFQTDLAFAAVPAAEGQYFIATSTGNWSGVSANCRDHTTGNGNMMIVNGITIENAAIWKQTVVITPNTNYAFSFWLQSLNVQNPALLQLSINGRTVYHLLNATPRECEWTQFYVVWNSGSNTSAEIAIVNKRLTAGGNDFAIDDISFAPVSLQQESVTVKVEKPAVFTNADTTICAAKPVQLIASGAQTYQWTPAVSLTDANVGNPVASPAVSTQYIVTGTTVNGCIAKDTVQVNVFAKPAITVRQDTVICKNSTAALWVTGGVSYAWSPASSVSDPSSSNPVASPVEATTYQVIVTDANTCEYAESVTIGIHPDPVFAVTASSQICRNDSIVLNASGGDIFSWMPAAGLSDPLSGSPKASPASTTDYQVTITSSRCGETTTLATRVNVLPLPTVTASRSNDLDCSFDRAQLNANGARTYRWTPAASLNNPLIAAPVASPRQSTLFVVAGTDRNGCTNYDSVLVKVDNSLNKGGYLMPSAFTPNNDGVNDCFGIKLWGIVEEVEFSIFNRWGERVFLSKNKDACWDGTFKGEKQAAGVFVYMIKAKTNCEAAVFRKGTFVLIR